MDLAEFRCAPYGKALKRLQTRGAKAATDISMVLRINAEPKNAKKRAREYANEHKGIYSLYKVEEVKLYSAEKE